jgi:GntR family transcriptional repressor for pyruvate dehydrogenase complex
VFAEQLKISRLTLRRAIQQLADAGILTVHSGRGGTYVKSDLIPLEMVTDVPLIRTGEVGDILAARRLIEPGVARLAALTGTDEDFETIQRTIDYYRRYAHELAGGPVDEGLRLRVSIADTRFHTAIARATRNPTIIEIMGILISRLEVVRARAIENLGAAPYVISLHDRTLAAIAGGDSNAIEAIMDEHLSVLERAWEEQSGRPLRRRPPDFLLPLSERSV